MMLTLDEIKNAVAEVAPKYHVTKVTLFGSYANGTANDDSDVDLIVEFSQPIGLLTLSGLKIALEENLGVAVDVIYAPIPDSSILIIDKEVAIYAA